MATTVTLKPNAIDLSGSTSGTTTLQATAVAGTTTVTLPAATDTLVGKATTDTLTNKTLTGAVMNGTVGATTPSTGSFTSLAYSTTLTGGAGIVNFGSGQFYKDASGNVGIGNAAPDRKLYIAGGARTGSLVSDIFAISDGATYTLDIPISTSEVSLRTNLNNLSFQTVNSERMRIDSSGNVGIGTTTPTAGYKLNVGSTSSVLSLEGAAITLFTSGSLTSSIGGVLNFRPQLGTTINDIFNLSICAYDHSGDGNADGLSINGSDGVSFSTGGNSRNERMRIDSSGNLMVGANALSNGKFQLYQPSAGTYSQQIFAEYASGTGYFIEFIRRNSGTNNGVGAISASTTTTTYATSSDYRLKENIAPITGALTKISALKPVTYKWKLDGSSGEGFIAHELAEICPNAVVGEKDAVDADGNPKYQGIDTSFLVATLTAALQETKALIDTQAATINALTARLVTLENK
jgi:hypothetical protein